MTIVFFSQLSIFLSSLCRMKTSWGLFNSLKMLFKHFRTMQRLGKREVNKTNRSEIKRAMKWDHFTCNCNCAIVLLPYVRYHGNKLLLILEKCLWNSFHFSLLVSVSSFVYEAYTVTAVSMMTTCGNTTIVSNIVKHGGQKQNTLIMP